MLSQQWSGYFSITMADKTWARSVFFSVVCRKIKKKKGKKTLPDWCLKLLFGELCPHAAYHFFTASAIPTWKCSHLLHATTRKMLASSSSSQKQFCFFFAAAVYRRTAPAQLFSVFLGLGWWRCEVLQYSLGGASQTRKQTCTPRQTPVCPIKKKKKKETETSGSLQNKQNSNFN